MYSLVKNTKYSFRKQSTNRLRVDVLLTSCSPGRNRAKHGDSREIKTKTSFSRVGTNSATDCSTFCTSPWNFLHSFSIGMVFWMTPQGCIEPIMLHWVQIAIIVSLRNRTVERGGRQNACVAKVTGLCVVVIFTKYQCFSVFYKKICLKEDEVWGNFFSNKIIVTLVRQGLPSSLLARPVAYSHTKMAATVKNLTFTDEELLLNVLVGYNRKGRQQRWLGECKSKVGGA